LTEHLLNLLGAAVDLTAPHTPLLPKRNPNTRNFYIPFFYVETTNPCCFTIDTFYIENLLQLWQNSNDTF